MSLNKGISKVPSAGDFQGWKMRERHIKVSAALGRGLCCKSEVYDEAEATQAIDVNQSGGVARRSAQGF